jgi:hypothetical protein
MSAFSRKMTIAAILAAGFWATNALAQTKDLQVEQAPARPYP